MDLQAQARPIISVVVPMYNEAAIIGETHRRLIAAMATLGVTWEVIYVNDGSTDTTLAIIDALRQTDRRLAVLNLSRNFGKEIATTAGLDHARGDAVIVMDADLQDPPEVIPQLVAAWHDGYDTVYAQRRRRDGDTRLKKATAAVFYRLMRNVGDVASAGERRRLPADEPARGGRATAAARAPSVHERPVRLGGVSHHRRGLRS